MAQCQLLRWIGVTFEAFAADASAGFCFPELFTILGRSLCGESIQDLGNG